MSPTIELPEPLFKRLQALAEPLVDTTVDVIDRAVQCLEQGPTGEVLPAIFGTEPSRALQPSNRDLALVASRAPRERGISATVGDHLIIADTVRDLFEQTLRYLVDSGRIAELRRFIPYKTSRKRYLIAEVPEHPQGNPFVIAAQYNGLFMEAHKSYQTAVQQLKQFLLKGGVDFRYHR